MHVHIWSSCYFFFERCSSDFDLVRLYHPDKIGVSAFSDLAHARFQAITAAYDILRRKSSALDDPLSSSSSASPTARYQTTAAYRAMRKKRQELYNSGPVDDSRKDKIIIFGVIMVCFFVWISFCEVWFLDHCYCAGANRVRAKRSFVWKPVTTSTSYTKHTFDSKWGRPAISKPLPEVGYFIIALHSRLYISSSIYLMYFNPQESCNKLCPRFSRPPFVVLRGLYSICEFTLRRTYLFAVGRTASIMHHAFSIMTQSDAYPRKTRLRRLSYKHDVVVLSS